MDPLCGPLPGPYTSVLADVRDSLMLGTSQSRTGGNLFPDASTTMRALPLPLNRSPLLSCPSRSAWTTNARAAGGPSLRRPPCRPGPPTTSTTVAAPASFNTYPPCYAARGRAATYILEPRYLNLDVSTIATNRCPRLTCSSCPATMAVPQACHSSCGYGAGRMQSLISP